MRVSKILRDAARKVENNFDRKNGLCWQIFIFGEKEIVTNELKSLLVDEFGQYIYPFNAGKRDFVTEASNAETHKNLQRIYFLHRLTW